MDQVKQILAVLKKHHFWVLCGLVALLGLGFWWTATAGLSQEYAANKGKIDSNIKDVEAVLNITPHPNEKGVEVLDEQIKKDEQAVLQAWETLYNEQKTKLFQWPADFGEDFVQHVEAPENQKEFRSVFLDYYADNIGEEVAKLGEIVDSEWISPDAAGASGGMSGMMRSMMPGTSSTMPGGSRSMMPGGARSMMPGMGPGGMRPFGMFGDDEVVKQYKVAWNPSSQSMIMDWFTWTETPSTVAVKVAQEDLWAYTALCNIIAATNANATGAHDVAVSTIEEMSVGYDAADASWGGLGQSRLKTPGADSTSSGMMSMPMMGPSMPGMEGGEGGETAVKPPRPVESSGGAAGGSSGGMRPMMPMMGMGGESAMEDTETPDQKLLSWRYLDETGKPLTAAELEESTAVGYRMLPFRMSLTVDQRQYDRLLLECRNSLLPVVVQEVRINPTVKSGGSGMGGSMMGMRSSPMPSSTSRGSSSMTSGMMPGAGGTGTTLEETHYQPVEIYGVMYMMLPPDASKIGISTDSEESAEGEADASEDASTATSEGAGGEQPTDAEGTEPSTEATTESGTEDTATDSGAAVEPGTETVAPDADAAEEPGADVAPADNGATPATVPAETTDEPAPAADAAENPTAIPAADAPNTQP